MGQQYQEKAAIVKMECKETLNDLIHRPQMVEQLQSALPKHITVEKISKMALNAASRSPKLLQCSRDSFLKAVLDGATLGLPIDGTLGQGYLVPFWNGKLKVLEAQFIPGYRGLIKLARWSGEITDIYAQPVYRDDIFEWMMGDRPSIKHVRPLDSSVADEDLIGAYMVAHILNGGTQIEVMNREQLEGIKARSPSKRDGKVIGPWVTDFAEMCRKTVTRRGCKWLPMSIEEPLAQAVQHETAIEADYFKNVELPAAPTVGDVLAGDASGKVRENNALPEGETTQAAPSAPADDTPKQQPEPEPEQQPRNPASTSSLW